MKYLITLLFIGFCQISFAQPSSQKLPKFLQGSFEDDYGSKYKITDSTMQQLPHSQYNIIEWNEKESYILAKNASSNSYKPGLFTRIDVIQFKDMEPFIWGYCYTEYKANSLEEARQKTADKENPRKGCNGFPFTRMKALPL